MMETPNRSTSTGSLDSSEQKDRDITYSNSNANLPPCPLNRQPTSSLDGPVAILWDIESCPLPSDVRPEDVAGNVTMALQVHPIIKGAVVMFSAYGDFNNFPRRLREGCQRTGVKLTDVPSGRKNAADKAILIDMFLFALDNQPPSSIMLISGDVDFAPALHVLGQRGYTIILVTPAQVGMSTALSNAGKFVWDWPSIARGEGFVPPSMSLAPTHVPTEVVVDPIECQINGNFGGQNEEAPVHGVGISQNYHKSKCRPIVSQSLSEYKSDTLNASCLPMASRSHSLPSTLNNVSGGSMASSSDQNECPSSVQPGDLNDLKCQLIKLLEFSGGCLLLAQLLPVYQKYFGRSLSPSKYGARKLVSLLKKMGDPFSVEGKGSRMFVYLRNSKLCPLSEASNDNKGKGTQKESAEIVQAGCSVDEERITTEEHDERSSIEKIHQGKAASNGIRDQILEQFKHELQEILVIYSCPIFIDCFDDIYRLRYKKPPDYQRLGVDKLEDLFEKVSDVVAMHEEPVSKTKCLVAVHV